MSSYTLNAALASALEEVFQRLLKYAPAAQVALNEFDDQCLQLEIIELQLTAYFEFDAGEVKVRFQREEPATTVLRGSLINLLLLLFSDSLFEPSTNLSGTGVTLEGNPQLLVRLKNLARQSDFDWEAPICEAFGDLLGPLIAQGLKTVSHKMHTASQMCPMYIAEYLTEELQAVVSRHELEDFYQSVDQLRADTDRLEARINKLQNSPQAESH